MLVITSQFFQLISNFESNQFLEKNAKISCNFVTVIEKHSKPPILNFHMLFLRGDGLGEDIAGEGPQIDYYATTSCLSRSSWLNIELDCFIKMQLVICNKNNEINLFVFSFIADCRALKK